MLRTLVLLWRAVRFLKGGPPDKARYFAITRNGPGAPSVYEVSLCRDITEKFYTVPSNSIRAGIQKSLEIQEAMEVD